MAMTIEQQRALALAQAKASAAQAGNRLPEGDPMSQGAPRADGGGNPVADVWNGVKNGVTNAFQTEAKNTDLSNPMQAASDALSAGFTSGVNAIPFVGDKALSFLEQLKANVQGRTQQDVAASDQAQVDQHPVASTAGTVVGTVAPFAAAGSLPVAGRLLGMTGSLPSRIGFGAASSALITGGDAAMRGADPIDAIKQGGVGGLIGAAFPVAERVLGGAARLVTGSGAPREAQNVARALNSDGIPVDQVNQRLQQLGPDAMLMDLGPNLQAQAGAVASVPGPGQTVARDAIAARGQNATNRVNADVTATVGNGPEIGALRDNIVQAQSAAADPIYTRIRNIPLGNLPQLAAVARTPMGNQALHAALTSMENDGVQVTNGQFTVGLADYMKRALDDLASSAGREGRNNVARQARNMTRAITSAVDRVVPDYRLARDAFAGPAQVLDAIDTGTTVFSREMSPAQLRRELAAMSPSERAGHLAGAQAQVEAMMGNAVNDVAALRNTFRKGWNEAKLRILLGDNVANDLLRRIDRELAYGRTANAVSSNSETARRQASQGEVNPNLGTTPRIQATLTGIVLSAFDGARHAIQGVRQPRINSHMADFHTSGQLTPGQIRQLQNGGRVNAPSLIAPAGPALLEKKYPGPVQITVGG